MLFPFSLLNIERTAPHQLLLLSDEVSIHARSSPNRPDEPVIIKILPSFNRLSIYKFLERLLFRKSYKTCTFAGMRIDIITVAPELLKSPFEHSIMKRAKNKGLVEIHLHDLRDYGLGNYHQIDDTQFGGGAGMVLMIEPIAKCIEKLHTERYYDEVIYMTPDAKTLNQTTANTLSLQKNILILTGHYKGVDQRVRDRYITREISIGDYVLTGGELAAAVLCDSIVRLIPGVLGDGASALTDSFQDNLLSPPVYTRPAEYEGIKVPEILLSGNFPKIDEWRTNKAYELTKRIRPDLLDE